MHHTRPRPVNQTQSPVFLRLQTSYTPSMDNPAQPGVAHPSTGKIPNDRKINLKAASRKENHGSSICNATTQQQRSAENHPHQPNWPPPQKPAYRPENRGVGHITRGSPRQPGGVCGAAGGVTSKPGPLHPSQESFATPWGKEKSGRVFLPRFLFRGLMSCRGRLGRRPRNAGMDVAAVRMARAVRALLFVIWSAPLIPAGRPREVPKCRIRPLSHPPYPLAWINSPSAPYHPISSGVRAPSPYLQTPRNPRLGAQGMRQTSRAATGAPRNRRKPGRWGPDGTSERSPVGPRLRSPGAGLSRGRMNSGRGPLQSYRRGAKARSRKAA